MTPWQVIEEALARKRPRRGAKWLADQLGLSIAVVSNWKARRVPPERYREIANVLGITLDQLEGLELLPWGQGSEWPFEDRALLDRVTALAPPQRMDIQRRISEMVRAFEREASGNEQERRDADIAKRLLAESRNPVSRTKELGKARKPTPR